MKKTVFSKIFINNILCAFIAIIVLISIEFTLMTKMVTKSFENSLKNNATIIIYVCRKEWSDKWTLYIE